MLIIVRTHQEGPTGSDGLFMSASRILRNESDCFHYDNSFSAKSEINLPYVLSYYFVKLVIVSGVSRKYYSHIIRDQQAERI